MATDWALLLGTIVLLSFSVLFILMVGQSRARIIREQQEKLQIIEASEKKYRNLIKAIDDGVFLVNKSDIILFVNEKFANVVKVPVETLIYQNIREIIRGEGRELLLRSIDQAFRSGQKNIVEHKLITEGKKYWFETVLIPQFIINNDTNFNILGISRDITERKAMEFKQRELVKTLKSQQKTLQHLSKGIIRAEEGERARISREIHDGVGQALTAITFNLELLNNPRLQFEKRTAIVKDCKNLVKNTMNDVHRFARKLRPAILDELGLIPALLSHARGYAERTGMDIKISHRGTIERIDDELKTALFRIFQESLNNIVKHAKAGKVRINLECEGDELHYSIEDDGKGFDPEKVLNNDAFSGGFGIKGMRERLALLGGTMDVFSELNKGTRLSISIPCANT